VGTEGHLLIEAVTDLREAVAETDLPFAVRDRDAALLTRRELLQQLDDYVLPRLRSIDAPLLAVVGGSTGAGKSTLVNSLVGAQVSRSGVIRPTTRRPVLVHHPDDEHWFTDGRILPGLSRVTGAESEEAQAGTVRLARSTALPAGMALLDAPDIDSVVQANRELAGQLLSAADLWLFVTTAARYADAVPWDLLRTAADRGTAVAIILDRVPPEAVDEIRPHLITMLREQGLSTAPVFAVPEVQLTTEGFLPAEAMARLKGWLDALATDSRARSIVVSQTLKGAIASLESRTHQLASVARDQAAARQVLLAAVDEEFGRAHDEVKASMTDGSLLRGEVLARWQEFVGTGEFFRQVETTIGKWRDRITAAVKGSPPPAATLGEALQTGVAALVTSHGESAITESVRDLRRSDGGDTVLAAHPDLAQGSPDFRASVDRLVRDWQGEIFDMVRTEGGNRRTNARVAAYGVNGIGLFLMLVTFAHTGGLSGAEVGIAGGASVLAQRVLEAVFGDQAVREMATRARRSLLARVDGLYAVERDRFVAAIEGVGNIEGQAARLDAAARAVAGAQQ